ncbi:MAG: hypothetical protein EOP00_22110 [Pedobacter sp.]|nr:MAG: hypothetical protein EOP00_22110 [Pedobacter sp.]
MIPYMYTPNGFDAHELINYYFHEEDTNIKPEHLQYICHCIISSNITHKEKYWKKYFKDGFIPLRADYLKNILSNYKACLDLLVQSDVIVCDNHFIVGQKAKGYRLHDRFIGNGFKKVNTVGGVKRQFWKQENKSPKSVEVKMREESVKHLVDHLKDPSFKINMDKVSEYLVTIKKAAQVKANNIFKYGNIGKAESILRQSKINCDTFQEIAENINSKDFGTIVDKKGLRLHSPLTRMPSHMRKFLTYKGQKIIALDIKNSQPYLTLLILCNHNFYSCGAQQKKEVRLKWLDYELYQLLLPLFKYIKTITLQKFPETLAGIENESLQKYIGDAILGRVYDSFVKEKEGTKKFQKARNKVKEQFMEVLFDVPKITTELKEFIEYYQRPFEVFNLIKSTSVGRYKKRRLPSSVNRRERALEALETRIKPNQDHSQAVKKNTPNRPLNEYVEIDEGYTKLATLLQRIESYIVLDVVCKKINQIDPTIPLFTVHDSIATTEPHVNLVYDTIMEECKKIIGCPPKVHHEKWFL